MKYASLIILLICGTATGSSAEALDPQGSQFKSSKKYELTELIRLGLRRSYQVRAAVLQAQGLKAQVQGVKMARVPTVELTSTLSPMIEARGSPTTDEGFRVTTGSWGIYSVNHLKIFAPLYTFGKLPNALEVAREGYKAGRAGIDIARRNVAFNIIRAYWGVKLSKEINKLLKEGRERLKTARKKLMELLDKDSDEVEEVDRLKMKVYSAEFESRYEDAKKFAWSVENALKLALSLSRNINLQLDDRRFRPHRFNKPKMKTLLADCQKLRPEIKALNASVRARQAALRLRSRQFLPDLFFAGGFSYAYCSVCTDQSSPFAYDPYNYYGPWAMIGLRWKFEARNIFHRRKARAEYRRALTQVEMAREGLGFTLRKAYQEHESAARKLKISKGGFKGAQGWLIGQTINFNTGLTKLKNLLDALTAWFKHRLAYMKAIYEYNVSIATLMSAAGSAIPWPEK